MFFDDVMHLIFRKCNSFNKFNIQILSKLCNILSIQNKRRKISVFTQFYQGKGQIVCLLRLLNFIEYLKFASSIRVGGEVHSIRIFSDLMVLINHHDLVNCYGISVSKTTTDMFSWSYSQCRSHLSFITGFLTQVALRVPIMEQKLLTLSQNLFNSGL